MSGFDVDDLDLRKVLDRLGEQKTSRMILSSMRKGLNIIAKETTLRFKTNRRGFAGKKVVKRSRGGKEKEVQLKVAKVVISNKEQTAKVHIMEDYRVKWFESGTKERKTKGRKIYRGYWKGKKKLLQRLGKGHRTGRIKPEWFFKKSIRAKEAEAEQKINQEIKRVFTKLSI